MQEVEIEREGKIIIIMITDWKNLKIKSQIKKGNFHWQKKKALDDT